MLTPSAHTAQHSRRAYAYGFSLIELAMVLMLVGLLLGATLSVLPAQLANQHHRDTTAKLEEARQALLGFAATNARMPCPATEASQGYESFCSNASGPCGAELFGPGSTAPSHGRCSVFASANASSGLLPSLSLGLSGALVGGVNTDSWGGSSAHRLRYALSNRQLSAASSGWLPIPPRSQSSFYPFSAPRDADTGRSGLQDIAFNAGLNSLDAINGSFGPQLVVCNSSSGASSSGCASHASTLAIAAVAVLYSAGPNAPTGGSGADEAQNPNPNGGSNDRVFVWHPPYEADASDGGFDDQLIWLSGPELYSRLISVGQLP